MSDVLELTHPLSCPTATRRLIARRRAYIVLHQSQFGDFHECGAARSECMASCIAFGLAHNEGESGFEQDRHFVLNAQTAMMQRHGYRKGKSFVDAPEPLTRPIL